MTKLDDSIERLSSAEEEYFYLENNRPDTEYTRLVVTEHEDDDKRYLRCIPKWLLREMWTVFELSITVVAIFITTIVGASLSLLFSGHLGVKELGAVSLANTILKVAGQTIGNGLATACDTLFSQTYGSGNLKQVGVYLQRSILIIGLSVLPCWAIFFNCESILRAVGQDPEVAKIADSYIMHFFPVLLLSHVYTILARYLRNQNVMYPTLVIGVLALGVNSLLQYLFLIQWERGTDGSALAQAIGIGVSAAGLVGYTLVSGVYKKTWGGFSMEALQAWGPFLSLALFGLLNICLQWFAFEIGTLLAGTLGDVQLGSQSIMFQLETITYCFAIGTGIGGNIRVGHLLGANNPKQAKRAVLSTYIIGVIQAAFIVLILISLMTEIPKIYSNDQDVIEAASGMIPILALYTVFDQICGCSSGILRGCGRQKTAAIIIFCTMYMIGLPIGITLMFTTSLKASGFWLGASIALVIQAIIYFVVVMKTDWDKEAKEAQSRAGVKSEKSAGTDYDEDSGLLIDAKENPMRRQGKGLKQQVKYVSEYESSQPDVSRLAKIAYAQPLNNLELLFRRTLAVLSAFLVLGIGIFCRFHFTNPPISHEVNSTVLCIPANSTNFTSPDFTNGNWLNLTLPLCPNVSESGR